MSHSYHFLFSVYCSGLLPLDFEVPLCAFTVVCCLTNSIQQSWRLCQLLCSRSKELFMFNNGFNVCFTTLALQLRHGGGGLTLKVCVLAVWEDFSSLQIMPSESANSWRASLVLHPLMSSFVSHGPFEIILSGSLTLALCMFPYVHACSSYVVYMLNLLWSVCNGPFG